MRKLILIIAAFAAVLAACNKEEETTWDKYREWRELNNSWLAEMQARTNEDGTPYYKVVIPDWNPGAFVLVHWFNDPEENAGKLAPLYTSTVDVRYKLHLYDGTPVDSSDMVNETGKLGIYRTQLTSTIIGWPMALTQVHCGDTVEVICPYGVAYGAQAQGIMPPYSNLKFNIRLVDIPYYELAPYE
ncbi:MAG: FKBP-type peptidyl-prolyl cis-trans isomerase [Muribaculaceae bacterium]|nr:FKBP-type peptidyl-prolyl cis-trans isomerase [Muribaculaceae bacterium]